VVEDVDFDAEVDFVGITGLTCVIKRAYAIADRFRERGVKVVLGGIHPSLLPEEAKEHADSVFIGEAEGSSKKSSETLMPGNSNLIIKIERGRI